MTPQQRRLEGDYSTGPWKYTPQKLQRRRHVSGWWILPATVVGAGFWLGVFWLAGWL